MTMKRKDDDMDMAENLGDISYWRQVERCCSIDSIVCRGCCLKIIMPSIIDNNGVLEIITMLTISLFPGIPWHWRSNLTWWLAGTFEGISKVRGKRLAPPHMGRAPAFGLLCAPASFSECVWTTLRQPSAVLLVVFSLFARTRPLRNTSRCVNCVPCLCLFDSPLLSFHH